MSQVLVLQVDYEIVQKLGSYRVGEDITIILIGESVYVLNYCIINCCIVFRLASASLFQHFPNEVGEVYTFKRLLLPEVVNVVLAYLDGPDRL